MGAESYILQAIAESPEEAYKGLVEEARDEYGYDPYNGTISTTDGFEMAYPSYNPKNVTKKSIKDAYDYIKRDNNGRKYTATCIDCGIKGYILREVSRKATHKEPPRYETCYECVVMGERGNDEVIQSYPTKQQADKYMKRYLLHNVAEFPRVRKTRKLVSGTDTVTDFTVKSKTYKSRPHPKNMEDKQIIELHGYIFYGFGAC